MLNTPTRICVFCSTTAGNSPAHLAAAHSLAQVLNANNIQLVYGAGTTGLMGELAKTLVSLSGPDSVHGIIPEGILEYERPESTVTNKNIAPKGADPPRKSGSFWARFGFFGESKVAIEKQKKAQQTSSLLSEEIFGRTTIVRDMQARKKRMAREVATGGPGSGFIGLSGGFGTMDELMEVVTWNQLGVHNHGVCLFNVEGFWDGLLSWQDQAADAGFVRGEGKGILVGRDTAEECVEWLRNYEKVGVGLAMRWGDG